MDKEKINIGDKVIYIPSYLLMGDRDKMMKEENLGVVTSKNDYYVFVRYNNSIQSQGTKAEDLFSLKNRPDLCEKVVDYLEREL